MSLLRHRLVMAHRLIEENRIEHSDLGWIVHRLNGHDYEVSYNWRQFVQNGDGWLCSCKDRLFRSIECVDIKATKLFIERHKEVKV